MIHVPVVVVENTSTVVAAMHNYYVHNYTETLAFYYSMIYNLKDEVARW